MSQPSTGVSTLEEANTLIMLHTAEISKGGNIVQIMTQDTDVMVPALQKLTVLGLQTTMFMGTSDNRRTILLKPICPSWYIKSCSTFGISLFNRMWHMWTYCGIGKETAFKACIEATPAHTVTSPYTHCILSNEARSLVFLITITEQFSILHKFVNDIYIKLKLFLVYCQNTYIWTK